MKPMATMVTVLALVATLALAPCSGSNRGASDSTAQASQGAATTSSSDGQSTSRGDLASPAQDVLNRVYPSVVNIAVKGDVGGQTGEGVGSGVVYTADGIILTNDHVVTLDGNLTSGQQLVVTFAKGEKTSATIIGQDSSRDIAAIKVDKTGLTAVTFAKSSEVKLAEWAIVIGSPLDFKNSISLGIISGLERTLDLGNGQPPLTGLIQIDAAISPGNSGGGCFDARGRFVGMPEVYLPPGQTGAENVGFAIPADVVSEVAKRLTGR